MPDSYMSVFRMLIDHTEQHWSQTIRKQSRIHSALYTQIGGRSEKMPHRLPRLQSRVHMVKEHHLMPVTMFGDQIEIVDMYGKGHR